MAGITLKSAAFNDHAMIPHEYSHEAGDVSPELEWTGVPGEAVELALLCEVPDAPDGVFTHWLVAGIPPETTRLEAGDELKGFAVGTNDFGAQGYGGPCPPLGAGPHLYLFRLFALSWSPGLGDGFSPQALRVALKGNMLASGTLTGTYGR
jgi:Raf kinase inhibitor-like YbhB/YbcL family protein